MNLRFVWAIFRKDARRLWWMIALTLAMLARYAYFDSWRSGAGVGSDESWLHGLLVVAWSLLVAMAVLDDPVVNDSPFWVTVPCRWPSLLAAKTVFVLVFVHLPYLLACGVIVHARGFAPFDYLPVLLDQQFILLAVTLPAVAVATLVESVTQFMIVALVLITAVAAPSISNFWPDGLDTRHVREILVFSITSLAALCVAVSQYGSRRTSAARIAAAAAILMGVAIWWLPRERFDRLVAAVSPTMQQVSIHLADPAESRATRHGFDLPGPEDGIRMAIPLTVAEGRRQDRLPHMRQSELRLEAPDGHTYSASVSGLGTLTAKLHGYPSDIPDWQLIVIGRGIFERIRDIPVNIDGQALITYYRLSEPAWMSADQKISVAGLGTCSSEIEGYSPSDENLKVGCESPLQMPVVNVRVFDPATGRDWNQMLWSGGVAGPWFSPVNRADTFFSLTDEKHYRPGLGVPVPREIFPNARIAITFEIPEGSSVVGYQLPNIRLRAYEVKQ